MNLTSQWLESLDKAQVDSVLLKKNTFIVFLFVRSTEVRNFRKPSVWIGKSLLD